MSDHYQQVLERVLEAQAVINEVAAESRRLTAHTGVYPDTVYLGHKERRLLEAFDKLNHSFSDEPKLLGLQVVWVFANSHVSVGKTKWQRLP